MCFLLWSVDCLYSYNLLTFMLFLLKILLYLCFFGKCLLTRFRNSADVCLYAHVVGWIKRNYVSLSDLAAILCNVSCWFLAFNVGKFFVVSALFKCIFLV